MPTPSKRKVTVEIDQSEDDDESMAELSDSSEDVEMSEKENTDSDKDVSNSEMHNSNSGQEDLNEDNDDSVVLGEDSEILSKNDDESEEEVEHQNAGWADSMAKILKMGKPKGKKSLVLSKAKKLADVKPKDKTDGLEIVKANGDEAADEKPTVDEIKTEDTEESRRKLAKRRVRKKNEIPRVRVKPKVIDKDRERTLSKIATRGVVQLFNAVRNQQKAIDKTLEDAGPLDRKKDKALKKFDKRSFLDALMGPTRSTIVDQTTGKPKKELKKEDAKPKWNVLRDNFMMGAKMKDWDKEAGEADAEDN